MESREDKLIALIVLLSACLITVVFLFAVTWLNHKPAMRPSRNPRRHRPLVANPDSAS